MGIPAQDKTSDLVERDKEAMKTFYEDTSFVPSLTIDQIGPALNAVGSHTAKPKAKTKKAKTKTTAKNTATKATVRSPRKRRPGG